MNLRPIIYALFREIHLGAAMDVASKIRVVEGGPAGSGVIGATISAAPERLGGAGLGNILEKHFSKISIRILASSTQP
jgi:hypothetical protein